VSEPFTAAVAANRFGLGARPGELAQIGAQPRDWLRAQLNGPPPLLVDGELRSSAETLSGALEIRRESRVAKREKAAPVSQAAPETATQANALAAVAKVGQLYRPAYVAESAARLRAAVVTQRPFVERLVGFWTNHFALSVDKRQVLGVAGAFEREAIRPNVMRYFADLLLAAEQHPAMLLYLDNHLSVGPNSQAARALQRRQVQRRVGINENLARETLELHTLGVGGGYTQKDVTTFAEVLTGWSIGGDGPRAQPREAGCFVFRPELHEPGDRMVLGRRYPDGGLDQGVAVLRDLAAAKATAYFLATKLVRHFVADEPPLTAVARVARAWLDSKGYLPAVYRALIEAPEAWKEPLSKFKTPNDYVVSTYRGLGLPVDQGRLNAGALEQLGQRTYSPGSPAGWPDRGADWDGASALFRRIEWADAVGQRVGSRRDAAELAPLLLGGNLRSATRTAIARATSGAQAITLLLAAPEFMRR
jgi:uncharacterized protein (DUF1800 family)